jgi:hypothetical protein
MRPDKLPIIPAGKRAVVAGRTGSGKSTLGCWLLNRSQQHWVILNPKWTKAYSALPDANILRGFNLGKMEKSIDKHRFTIINFNGSESNPDFLDAVTSHLHERYENIGLCADELYSMHKAGQCGAGLTGWLTRGRELKQTFLGMTQRPAWVSKFIFSEADFISSMDLSLADDRKRMYEFTGDNNFQDRLDPHRWLWYDVGKDKIAKFGPVPLIK